MMLRKKGYALLSSIIACLFFGIFIGLSFMRSSSLSTRGVVSRNAEDALYAAETGVQHALSQFRSDMGWTGTGGFQPITANGNNYGYFQTVVDTANIVPDNDWFLIPITVTGQNQSQTATRVVQAVIRAQSPWRFFISSISDLTIAAGANIGSSILGRNINFATLQPGQTININGSVQYFQNINPLDPQNIPGITITPPVNVEPTKKIDPVAFVGVDSERYQGLAANGGYVHSGSLTINGGTINRSYDFGGGQTAGNGVVFVNGDVHINGSVSESMAIVATGNIYITGDLTYSDQNDSSIQLGLFSQNNIIIDAPSGGGDRTLQAALIAENRLIANGTYASNGTLNFKGAMAIKGDPTTNATAIDLAAFSSRTYTYHQQLSTNCTIPAMSYMASIESWSIQGNPSAVNDYQQ